MTPSPVTVDGLTDALNDLVDQVEVARSAVVLSPDGLLLGASRDVGDDLARQLSSVVAGLAALGRAAARACVGGRLRQIVVQMSRSFLFVATIGSGAVLTVRMGGDAEVCDMAYEVALFVARAERHLPVYLEPATVGGERGAPDWRR